MSARKSLLVARFNYGGLVHDGCVDWYSRSLVKLAAEKEIGRISALSLDVTPTPVARNKAAWEAIEGDHDYLLMVDADMIPHPSWIKRAFEIVEYKTRSADELRTPRIVGAPYFNRAGGVALEDLDGKIVDPTLIPNHHFQVGAVGTGIMLIPTIVFKNLLSFGFDVFFKYHYDPRMICVTRSEDYVFCDQVCGAKMEVWCDGYCWAGHIKNYVLNQELVDGRCATPRSRVPASDKDGGIELTSEEQIRSLGYEPVRIHMPTIPADEWDRRVKEVGERKLQLEIGRMLQEAQCDSLSDPVLARALHAADEARSTRSTDSAPEGGDRPEDSGYIRETGIRRTRQTTTRTRTRPIRVGFATPNLGMGGAEQWLVQLARGLSEHEDFKVSGIYGTLECETNKSHPMLVEQAKKICPFVPGEEGEIRRALPELDILIAWGVGDLGKRIEKSDRKVVYVSHGPGPWTATQLGGSESVCSNFVAVSHAAAKPFTDRGLPHAILMNGIDDARLDRHIQSRDVIRQNHGFRPDDIVLGYVGRKMWDKNPLGAVVAAMELQGKHRVLLVGDGAFKEHVHSAAVAMCPGAVSCVEGVDNVGDYYRAMDLLVHMSHSEGMCLALLEAQYCGLPVLCHPVGAVQELERMHGPMHYTMPLNPSPGDLANHVRSALHNAKSNDIVPRAQRTVRSHYLQRHMVNRWKEYLIKLMRGEK